MIQLQKFGGKIKLQQNAKKICNYQNVKLQLWINNNNNNNKFRK